MVCRLTISIGSRKPRAKAEVPMFKIVEVLGTLVGLWMALSIRFIWILLIAFLITTYLSIKAMGRKRHLLKIMARLLLVFLAPGVLAKLLLI